MADCCSLFRKGCSTRQFGRGSLGAGSWLEPSQQLHVKRFVNSSRNCIRAKSCNPAVNVTTRRFRGLHNDCLYPGPIPNLLRCGLLGLHETCAGPSHRGTPLDLLVYALLDIPGPIANAHRLNSIPSLDRKRNATDENISIFPRRHDSSIALCCVLLHLRWRSVAHSSCWKMPRFDFCASFCSLLTLSAFASGLGCRCWYLNGVEPSPNTP